MTEIEPGAGKAAALEAKAVTTFPCYSEGCGRRVPAGYRAGFCEVCLRNAAEGFGSPLESAGLILTASHNRKYFAGAEVSGKFAALPLRMQVRVIALAASPSAPFRDVSEQERKWAESMRRGFPALATADDIGGRK